LYRSDTFGQDLASHFRQSNDDASRALVTIVINERAKGRLRANGDRSVTEATQPRTTPGKSAAEEDSIADLPVKKKGLECIGATCSSCCDKVSYKSLPEEPKGL